MGLSNLMVTPILASTKRESDNKQAQR